MELKFLYPYKEMRKYLENTCKTNNAWEEIMITPYWKQIAQWAGNSCDFMKPVPIKDGNIVIKQIEKFEALDLSVCENVLKNIISSLPKDDEDPMTVAFYPSENKMDEGVVGVNVWGNIIINVNPLVKDFQKWIPFVFAHEYHHVVLGYYWYCVKEGRETKGNFLEYLINEGEADEFAKSLYPNYQPSWQRGITDKNEQYAWEKLKTVLYEVASPQEQEKYMFGDEKLGIPPFAGYYFGSKIVKSFMEKHSGIDFNDLIKIPHQTIFNGSVFKDI